MVKLADTTNVSLSKQRKLDGKDFIEIPAIGDGNCALNSFALGLIDLIKREEAVLTDVAKQEQLMAEIIGSLEVLRDRLHLYETGQERGEVTGNRYSDLAHGLEEFINFVDDGPNYDDLVSYIQSVANTREQIAALHVALAPALRNIGAELYRTQMRMIADEDPALLHDAERLRLDGVSAGHETLALLAHDFFQINLNMFESKNGFSINLDNEIADAPVINVVHVPGHWNYLIDAEQKDGLAIALSKPEVSENDYTQLLDETESLVTMERAYAKGFVDPEAIVTDLTDAVQVVRQAGENLLVIGQQESTKEYDRLSSDHNKYSSSILNSVRENVDLSDESLASLKLSKLEKDLLLGHAEPAETITDDERLARALQDAEILSFFDAKHATFFGSKDATRIAEKKSDLDHRPGDKFKFD